MFYDRRYPFAAVLESEWRAIRAEYAGVRDVLVDWHETKLYEGGGWKVFRSSDSRTARSWRTALRAAR